MECPECIQNDLNSVTRKFMGGSLRINRDVSEIQCGQSFQNFNLRSSKPRSLQLLPGFRYKIIS